MRTLSFSLFTAVLALCLTHVAAAAAYLPGGPTNLAADVEVSATEVTWQPRGVYERVLLTVNGPEGLQLKRAFASGAAVKMIYDETLLPDGDYLYQLTMLGPLDDTGAVEPVALADGAELTPLATQVGAFTVEAGAFAEQAAHQHQAFVLHAGNVTIDGSACVGNDCNTDPPSPTYGFDTLRLQENNLRILAMDTSGGSFPTRDWQIEFNSSSNGGPSYYMVRDCGNTASTSSTCNGTPQFTIEAGADNDSIYIDSSGNQGGNVGFGTTNPAVDLDVLSGNTPTLRLQQDNSSGFGPQTWDVAGNEANFFIRDVTGGSALPIRIEPGTASNTLYLDNQERIGINTSSPQGPLHVRVNGGTDDFAVRDGGNVGIGTNAPEERLHIRTTVDVQTEALIENTFAGGKRVSYALRNTQGGGQEWEMAIKGNGDLQFFDRTANAERMTIARTTGDISIPGTLSKGGGSFRIDHPLDPENRYLSHSFIESPDMMNVYNGNVTTDERGEAVVVLPEYFEVLNRDFRYQLTAVGAPGPNLYVAEKISGNRFKIAGGQPGMEVSWQVTGVRQDPWAEANRIQVEETKPEDARGTYLHPEVYQQPPGQQR